MDDFIEQFLERSKARQEFLDTRKTPEVRKRRTVLLDEKQISSPNSDLQEQNDDSPKRQCLEADDVSYNVQKSNENKENATKKSAEDGFEPYVAVGARGLAALRKNKPSSNDTEVKEMCGYNGAESKVNNQTESSVKRRSHKSRFANLAAQIREWEDEAHSSTDETASSVKPKTSALSALQSSEKLFSFTDSLSSSSSSSSDATLISRPAPKAQFSGGGGSKRVSFHPDSKKDKIGKHVTHNSAISHPYSNLRKPEPKTTEVLYKSANNRKIVWDQAVLSTLECQGFVKSPSKLKISYNFAKNSEAGKNESKELFVEESSDEEMDDGVQELNVEENNIKNPKSPMKCAVPRKTETPPKPPKDKSPIKKGNEEQQCMADPAELPLSARKALFEKAFFGITAKHDNSVESNLSVAQRAAMFEKAAKGSPKKIQRESSKFPPPVNVPPKATSTPNEASKFQQPTGCAPKVAHLNGSKSPIKAVAVSNKIDQNAGKLSVVSPSKSSPTAMEVNILSPSKKASPHTRLVQQRLIESSASDWRKKDIVSKATDERKNEIAALVNHWEKVSSSSDHSCPDGDQQSHKSSSTSSETEKYCPVFSKHDNRNNENEESSESNDSENEDRDDEVSADEESYTESECTAEMSSFAPEEDCVITRRHKSMSENAESYAAEDAASVCSTIEEISDEVMESEVNHMPPPPGPPSYSKSPKNTSSSSHSLASSSSQKEKETCQSQYSTPTMNYDYSDTDSDVPLLHTVSFYRRQKQEKRSTPVRTIVRREQISSPPSPEVDNIKLIQQKIKALDEEIYSHQTVISQTSQALNLCHATEEFFGSTEQVEGERLLLIATQKRQACLNEIHRLKTHGALGKSLENGKGSLIMHDIKLPLKRDFIACQLENKDNDAVHYFLCLVRYGHQVIVTQMLSTTPKEISNGTLCFTNHITLHDLPPDFSIIFEVYALQTKKEVLAHEKKYHIKKEHSKIRLTPKGKKADSKLIMPAISSPGGPSAVRTPSFGVVGFTRLTLQNCNRKTYTLDKVPFSSPLDGVLLLKLQLHSEHNVVEKGFLTMYEDVSGKGALRRLWCVLDGRELLFWKYPDDEKRKNPILQIDLSHCITSQVKLLSRDICARPHTFQLLTARPQAEGDRNTLISQKINTLTTTKYMLSADTKEERILWCKRLNEALTNVRKWDPNALRPIEVKE